MSLEAIAGVLIPGLAGVIGYLYRTYMNKLSTIETELDQKITEQQTRQILADKLEPVKESLDEVKEKLDKLYDLLLK